MKITINNRVLGDDESGTISAVIEHRGGTDTRSFPYHNAESFAFRLAEANAYCKGFHAAKRAMRVDMMIALSDMGLINNLSADQVNDMDVIEGPRA